MTQARFPSLKSFLSALAFIAMCAVASTVSVRAASPTPSPATETEPTAPVATATPAAKEEEINRNLKERIMGIVAEQSDPRPEAEKRVKAYVGQVDKVTSESLFLKANRTQEAIRLSPQRTTIVDMAKQTPLQFQEIELGSWAIVMGVMTDDDVLEARRVLISAAPLLPKPKTIFFGSVNKINSSSVTINRIGLEPISMKLNRSTKISDKDGNKVAVSKIKPEMRVVLTISPDQVASGAATLLRLTQELPAEQ